jgi:hypothetical protein
MLFEVGNSIHTNRLIFSTYNQQHFDLYLAKKGDVPHPVENKQKLLSS